MSRQRPIRPIAAIGLASVIALAGCGGDSDKAATTTAAPASNVSGSLTIVGVWTGDEQKSFQAVLDGFTAKNPKVEVKYTSAGDNVSTVLGTAVQGGSPPDLASIAQPGLIKDFHAKHALKPLDFADADVSANYSTDIAKLGTIGGKLYSFVFKAANKSTVWYNVAAFKSAGVKPPADWGTFLANAKTLKASGVPAYSLGGADGWTLTDLFENVYLRQAGAQKYDALTDHEIKWTDASVKTALRTMADVLGDTQNIAGGKAGALQTDFPGSVAKVFVNPAKAAQVIEGDFVPGAAAKTKLEPKTGYDVFPFPSIGAAKNVVVGGGDSIVMFKDKPAARALVKYLASPTAAGIWAKRGGYSSANKNLLPSAYPDEITRTTATAIAKAGTFRFDLSDLEPASFGGTPGQGEWKILQDFLSNPGDVDATASALEQAAAKAFK
ncbi:MAG: alpha-glucoside transport system substrate-binding protein [Solirubrobacteraceae bacterium]|jgi:ABC-type glycerol-3-phosphate transport system substrate-binding protein|nr:alpha-glucoside transport system substrate-binding protein [Solirubrobacteraceae bacterium]